MTTRICCYTLFDITQTGVMNRSRPSEGDIENWVHRRNTQCNFDTVLQVISLRSQPEVISIPRLVEMTSDEIEKFGFLYEPTEGSTAVCWSFEFEVHHSSVFENGIIPLGALYKDCEGVPMINCKTQSINTPAMLDISDELKNIHFEEL